MNLKDIKKVYFVGIGGIGMSAIARFFNSRGIEVLGYDKTATVLTKKLEAEGMEIHFEDDVKHIPKNIDLVVYTPAIPDDHNELNYFFKNEYPVYKRSEVLGLISRSAKCLAIAGTHGKTTTTSILTHILKVGGVDCTAFLGGIAQNFESNYVHGESEYVVVEADEYDRSFLTLTPYLAAILSMDADHLDIYGSDENVKEGFNQFAEKVNKSGTLFLRNGLSLNEIKGLEISSFGLDKGIYRSHNVRVEKGFFVFDYKSPKESIENVKFVLPGHHNVENATAAIAIAQQLGVTGAAVKKALLTFKGVKRRFEFIYRTEGQVYIDDYAHHPTELKAAIRAAKTLYPDKKISGIFQPHLFSRTRDFVEDFAKALDGLDEVILMDIYPAREKPIPGVTSKIVFDLMENPNKSLASKSNLMEVLSERKFEVLMTLGAGDIDTFVLPIKEMIENG